MKNNKKKNTKNTHQTVGPDDGRARLQVATVGPDGRIRKQTKSMVGPDDDGDDDEREK